ncbi:MAG: NAD-dependent DNA ligase LigA [Candidatus Omnitrophota bacterium]|nr:MAG: NAD-dependent DNA ligase LigA [Candidatus Omnitrophota bacterium]
MLKPDKIKKKIQDLREQIRHADYCYYVLSEPEISDKEYDDLVKELAGLEKKYPELITADSPTQRVSGGILEGFATVRHKVKMLSLDNSYSIDELTERENKIKRMLSGSDEIDYTAELKIDGVSCSLTYEKGIFVQGATRGDGQRGEDITQNLRTIKSIPLKLMGESIPSVIEVRGEVYMDKTDFEKINKARLRKGEPAFANPRNSASGSLKLLDASEVKKRNLKCYIHSLGWAQAKEFANHYKFLQEVKKWGLCVNPHNRYCKNLKEVIDFCNTWVDKKDRLDYEVDGVVVKVNSFRLQQKLGTTLKSPRWAVAYKFPAQQATTRVKDVTFGVGRTGIITPVAILEPVECAGVTISRSTLHNFDEVKRLDIRIGDTILIERAGEVIPKVVKVITSKRKGREKKVKVPNRCPVCAEKITKEKEEEVYWYCINPDCPARLKQSLLHFTCRAAMDIEGMGSSVVDELVNRGMVKSIVDIYKLRQDDFLKLPLFAKKRAVNLVEAIVKSKNRSLSRFLYGLGIRGVGEKGASVLAEKFKDVEKLFSIKNEQLRQIPEIGEVLASSLVKFFSSPHVKKMISEFKKAGVNLTEKKKAMKRSALSGKIFIFTGELEEFSRNQARSIVKELGGEWVSSVSKNIDFVVAGNNPGSKYNKAKSLGLKIIGEKEFRRLIRR